MDHIQLIIIDYCPVYLNDCFLFFVQNPEPCPCNYAVLCYRIMWFGRSWMWGYVRKLLTWRRIPQLKIYQFRLLLFSSGQICCSSVSRHWKWRPTLGPLFSTNSHRPTWRMACHACHLQNGNQSWQWRLQFGKMASTIGGYFTAMFDYQHRVVQQ